MRINKGGIVFIVTGLLLLFLNLGILSWSSIRDLWPLLFVAVGISMLVRNR